MRLRMRVRMRWSNHVACLAETRFGPKCKCARPDKARPGQTRQSKRKNPQSQARLNCIAGEKGAVLKKKEGEMVTNSDTFD